MAIQVNAYRPPSRGGVPYEDWKEDASCKDLPVYFFELNDELNVVSNAQQELIARGLKVCSTCPVRKSCLVNSSPADRYWTTRGGQPPEGLFPDTKPPSFSSGKLQRKGFKSTRKPKGKCKYGHERWSIRADGQRRCLDCSLAYNRSRNKKGDTL